MSDLNNTALYTDIKHSPVNNKFFASISELEGIKRKIDADIEHLWFTVILPYITDISRQQILNNITSNDYHKFYKFMMQKNRMCRMINYRLNYLQSQL